MMTMVEFDSPDQNFKLTKRNNTVLTFELDHTRSRYFTPVWLVTTEPNICKDVGQTHPVSFLALFIPRPAHCCHMRTVIVTKGHTSSFSSLPQYRHRQLGQVQAEEMSPGVQEVMSRRQDRQAVYRSRQCQQDRLYQ
jgi:hypothetical protein